MAHLAPKGYEEGGSSNRLVGFVDFAPTMLSLSGVTIPDYYHGHAFAGDQQTEDPPYSFGFRGRMDERPDFVRSITDGRYLYMRNFYRHLPHASLSATSSKLPPQRYGMRNSWPANWMPFNPLSGNRVHGKNSTIWKTITTP